MNKSAYLNKAQLRAELERCLNCPTKPCWKACPVKCCPTEFIALAKAGEGGKAAQSILKCNPLGEICGLVCPDKFCMSACTRARIDFPINIPKVQATILYNNPLNKSENISKKGKKIAIIGAGPAGISAARMLAENGYLVEIFEAEDKVGGAINLIPRERLPKETIYTELNSILSHELINVHLKSKIDDVAHLLTEFEDVIVATGEQECSTLGIPGEEYCISYKDYLQHPEKYQTDGKVAIIGGGNVALDCATTVKKFGASAIEMFVRRRLPDMRISKDEFLELIAQEINVNTMTSPVKIEKSEKGLNMTVCRNQFVEKKLQKISDSETILPDFSLIITAVGSKTPEKTENEHLVYAGDCLHGSSTVVEAVASGLKAAEEIMRRS